MHVSPPVPPPPRPQGAGPWGGGIAWGVLGVGLLLAHHPMLFSGFRLSHGDWGDARLVNYLLEHSWRWLLRDPLHASFWDPPFFFPAKHVGAYTETLLGAAPVYWVWRVVQVPPDTAFQLWMLSVSALNFGAAYLALRRAFRLGELPAALGALLFAFASARLNQLGHPQLLPHWPTPLFLYFVARVFEPSAGGDAASPRRVAVLLHAAALCVVWQLWAAFYLGWFLVLALLIALGAALALRPSRLALVSLARAHPLALASAAVLSALLLYPLLANYLQAAAEVGYRSYVETKRMLPRLVSWIDAGPDNWAWGWLHARGVFSGLMMENEHRVGVGLVALLGGALGLVFGARRGGTAIRLVALTGLLLFVLCTVFPFTDDALWRWVYELFPGGKAIRAVARIGLVVLFPLSLGFALLFDALLSEPKARLAALLLAAFAVWEQGQTSPSFDKLASRMETREIAAGIDPSCEAFYWSPWRENRAPYWKVCVDAMWAALESRRPTVNGYSGHQPASWHLGDPNLRDPGWEQVLEKDFSGWLRASGLERERVCWVKGRAVVEGDGARMRGQQVPPSIPAGGSAQASVTVENVGSSTWRAGGRYRLGTEDPQDHSHWGSNRVELPHDVKPGERVTFVIDLQAPSQPGVYPVRWRMVHDGEHWFGEIGPKALVTVTP